MRILPRVLTTVLMGTAIVVIPASPAFAKCDSQAAAGETGATPWSQERMSPERVFELTRGEGMKVAVIDSGVSDKHRVLDDGKVSYGKDYTGDGNSASCDLIGHGTVIAGVIAGDEDPDGQFHGMAPDAEILAIRILAGSGKNTDPGVSDKLAAAINEAVKKGADVINLSVAFADSDKLEAAVENAHDKDVLLVAAGGNENGDGGKNDPVYPAAYGTKKRDDVSVLAVANVKKDGGTAKESNTNEYIDIAGPGEKIQGPSPVSETGYSLGGSGTSYSTAFVSGAAALVRARFPKLTAAEVADRLTSTAEHPPGGWNEKVGYGMVDPYRAVTADLDKNAEHEAGTPPRLHLPGDTEYFARNAAGVLIGATIAVLLAVALGRSVAPRLRRKREAGE